MIDSVNLCSFFLSAAPKQNATDLKNGILRQKNLNYCSLRRKYTCRAATASALADLRWSAPIEWMRKKVDIVGENEEQDW
jgi:hypothetical protein